MVKIVTDSSCDIPTEIARSLSISIVPLYIQFGDKTYRDGIDLDAEEFHQELACSQEIPKTSVPSPGDFLAVYQDLARETDQILSIHLASGYSGTCNVANLAKSYLAGKCHVEVIDSKLVSAGLGLIVIAAAKAAQEGKNLDEIVNLVHRLIPRTHMFGKIDNIAELLKGKRFRLGRALILLGKISTALNIKLLGEVYDGGKVRAPAYIPGEERALNNLKRRAGRFASVGEMAVAYSIKPDEAARLAELLVPLLPKKHILVTRLGCATSTYVGPGTLAMALIEGLPDKSDCAKQARIVP